MDGRWDGRLEEQSAGGRRARRDAAAATVAAVAALLAVPLVASVLSTGTPSALVSLPAGSIAVVLALLSIPARRLRAVIAGAFGVVVVLSILVAALDLGFEATIDRPFDVIEDVPSVLSAVGVVGDAVGTGNAILIVVLVVAALAAAAVALAAAALHAERATARSGRTGRVVLTALATAWIVAALAGAQLVPGVPLASAPAADTLTATWSRAAKSLRDDAAFQRALGADPLRHAPGDLLAALDGKHVVFAFVESYGRVAVQDAPFTAPVAAALQAGGTQLAEDGYAARSAFLTSPTFGGVSWLAHSTLQSGAWVNSQHKYDRLTSTDRRTLTRLFSEAGWHTVAVVPSNTDPWPVGRSFYGYDTVLDDRNMGYAGPSFSYARIPDQYTWRVFGDRVLADAQGPVMAEVDLVSSHTPWTPIPRLVPWTVLGNGSVFDAQPAEGPTPVEAWADPQRVRMLYGQSVTYTLEATFSFLQTYDPADLVLVLLGDHQPARIVSGPDADHDVPVTIIAKDPAVFDRISSWHWEPGIRPSATAPVWRMDQFRDRFVAAFTP